MLTRKNILITLLAAMAGGSLHAANTLTNYTAGDVLICFRNGGDDMVVDAGPISTFTSLSVNQRYTISAYTGDQLSQVGTNGTSWSAFTWLGDNTLYVTRPRSSLNSQTLPWQRKTSSNQNGTALRMGTIPLGAVDNLNFNPFNTSTAVIEEDGSSGNANYPTGSSYHDALSGAFGGNFNGTFQGNPENTTLNNFTTSGTVVRSDFYQLTPSSGIANGTYLGYFELNTNGVMTYVAYPSATPVIKSFNRSGNNTTIVYTTGLYGNYVLCATNAAGLSAPRSTWPAIANLTAGDSSQHSIPDITTESNRFYFIKAQ